MRVTTTVVVICFVSVLAMAIGAPRPCTPNCKNNNQGKSGERKKNRAKGRTPAEIPPLPGTTGREEDALTESDELLAPFVALDANGDGYITRKEYRNGSENGSLNKVFERIDTNEDRRISKEEFRFHRTMVANAAVSCDTFAMGRCAEKFSKHLSTQEGRLDVAGSTLSSNGLFCTALQIYVNCIGHEGNVCGELQTYAQRIERTSNAYRNAGICPDLNNTAFSAPNANSGRRHPTNPDRGETRRRSRGSRNIRAAKRRPSLTNGECLWNAFTSCHEDLYQSMSESPRGCTLTKNYRTCVKKSTKRCRDKSNVNKIMSGLKYIRKAHREANMCGLQT